MLSRMQPIRRWLEEAVWMAPSTKQVGPLSWPNLKRFGQRPEDARPEAPSRRLPAIYRHNSFFTLLGRDIAAGRAENLNSLPRLTVPVCGSRRSMVSRL